MGFLLPSAIFLFFFFTHLPSNCSFCPSPTVEAVPRQSRCNQGGRRKVRSSTGNLRLEDFLAKLLKNQHGYFSCPIKGTFRPKGSLTKMSNPTPPKSTNQAIGEREKIKNQTEGLAPSKSLSSPISFADGEVDETCVSLLRRAALCFSSLPSVWTQEPKVSVQPPNKAVFSRKTVALLFQNCV